MDRKNSSIRINSFPRSGNYYTYHLLSMSFPNLNFNWFSHNATLLESESCLVLVRNPYNSISSWRLFANEKNIEGTSKWYLRFYSTLLKNIENHKILDFEKLIKNPLYAINAVSNLTGEEPIEADYSVLDINKSQSDYDIVEDSQILQECQELYKKALYYAI